MGEKIEPGIAGADFTDNQWPAEQRINAIYIANDQVGAARRRCKRPRWEENGENIGKSHASIYIRESHIITMYGSQREIPISSQLMPPIILLRFSAIPRNALFKTSFTFHIS